MIKTYLVFEEKEKETICFSLKLNKLTLGSNATLMLRETLGNINKYRMFLAFKNYVFDFSFEFKQTYTDSLKATQYS